VVDKGEEKQTQGAVTMESDDSKTKYALFCFTPNAVFTGITEEQNK